MNQTLLRRFDRTNRLYIDLVDSLSSKQLDSKLPGIRSNSVGSQLWCVASARHSTADSIPLGQWQGFRSAMTAAESTDPEAVLRILNATHDEVARMFDAFPELSDPQLELLLGLLEHESFHHGQLVRYLYALDITRPPTWQRRYSLT